MEKQVYMIDNRKKKNIATSFEVNETMNKHKKVVREAFKDGGSVVTFDDMKVTPKELTDALVALDISFMMGDMPYNTKSGGITYKKTLLVSNQEKVQKIINEKD